jgi:peptidoglycan/LPS O-acetylase OafA/YrhL
LVDALQHAHYNFSLYLVHDSAIVLLAIRVFPDTSGADCLLAALLAGQVVAIASWRLFERHYRLVRAPLDRRTASDVPLTPLAWPDRD